MIVRSDEPLSTVVLAPPELHEEKRASLAGDIVLRSRTIARAALTALAFAGALGTGGCANGLSNLIVQTRVAQGQAAIDHGNLADARIAFRLALALDPNDARARAGLATVLTEQAAIAYRNSKFDEALADLGVAAHYQPQNVRVAELRNEVGQARVRREIVLSNFPAYRETNVTLRRSYALLRTQIGAIVTLLQRFGYTYDSSEVGRAIQASYELNAEVARLTSRLTSYKTLVDAGAPAASRQGATAPGGSLLPLP
ncbi:MAG: hypothetical protein ACREQ5_20125 [Candidatus Dormibacteria bacterium]